MRRCCIGRPVDKRADIWAYGCVLFEMLSGRRAFQGHEVSDVLAKVIEREPDFAVLPADTPAVVKKLVSRCLEKNPKRRVRDIGDMHLAMDGAFETVVPQAGEAVAASQPVGWRRAIPSGLVWLLVAALITGVAVWSFTMLRARPDARPARLLMSVQSAAAFTRFIGRPPAVAVSPDGGSVVFTGDSQSGPLLYLRTLDSLGAIPISGAEVAVHPFFSPAGEWVGFWALADATLKKVPVTGGAPLTICDAPGLSGAGWLPDDTIVFAPSQESGLMRVSAAGGSPEPLTTLDEAQGEVSHRWPGVLPGGKAVIFTIGTGDSWNEAQIGVVDVETQERHTILTGGSYPRYVPSGHLVFARAGSLMAVPIDLEQLAATGPPVSVVDGVETNPLTGSAQFSVSDDGSLVYFPVGQSLARNRLTWVGRDGVEQTLPVGARQFEQPRLSPDSRRIAVTIREEGNTDIWVYDLERGSLSRLTFAPGEDESALWTPDGRHISYAATRAGRRLTLQRMADGSGEEEEVVPVREDSHHHLSAWSPDGQTLAWSSVSPGLESGSDVWTAHVDAAEGRPLLQTAFKEYAPVFAPDGRWVAYVSNETGRDEIYVQAFPGPGGKRQISTDGGTEPLWSAAGDELFYRNDERMMVVTVETEPSFAASPARVLFEGRYDRLAWEARETTTSRPTGSVSSC